jgi:hypothetical protein
MDNTSNLLSENALNGDWITLTTRITNAIQEIIALKNEANGLTFDIKGSENLMIFSQRFSAMEDVIKRVAPTLDKVNDVFIDLNSSVSRNGVELSALIPKYGDLKAQINLNNEQIKIYKSEINGAESSLIRLGRTQSQNSGFAKELNKVIEENIKSISNLESKNNSLSIQLNAINNIEKELITTNVKLNQVTSDGNQALVEKKLTLSQVGKELMLNAQMEQEAFDKEVQIRVNRRILNQEISREVRNQTGEYDLALQKQIEVEERKALATEQANEKILLSAQKREIAMVEAATNEATATEQANSAEYQANKKLEGSILALQIAQEEGSATAAQYAITTKAQNKENQLNAIINIEDADTYNAMSAELRLLDIEIKKYTLDQIKSGEVDQELFERYKLLESSLKEYDAILGVNTRNVGNYKSVLTPLSKIKLEMVDIQRKGSAATAEETQRYRELEIEAKRIVAAQNEVNDSLKVGKSQVQQFGDMFHRQFLRMIITLGLWYVAFGALQKLWEWFTLGTKKTQEARKELEDYNQKLRDTANEATATAAKEQAASKILIQTANDINASMSTRIDAINELRKAYKGLFEDYSNEEIMTGKAISAYDKMDKAIILKANIQAQNKNLTSASERGSQALDIISDREGIIKRTQDWLNTSAGKEYAAKYIKTLRNEGSTETDKTLMEHLKVPLDKVLDESTPNGRLEKERLAKRSMYDKMFDDGSINIKEQKDQVDEQKQIYENSLKDEQYYIKVAQDQSYKLNKLTESKKKNIVEFKNELSNLKTEIDSRNLPQDIIDLIEGKTDDPKANKLRKLLKDKHSNINTKETEDLINRYKSLQTSIELLEAQQDPKGSHPKGKNKNKIEMESLLRQQEEERKIKDDNAQKNYDQSKKTYQDEYELINNKINNEKNAWKNEADIMARFSGKIGETQDQELARYEKYQAEYATALNKSVEVVQKIDEEINNEYKKVQEYDKNYVKSLEETKKKIIEIQEELQDRKVKFAIDKSNSGIDLFGIKAEKHKYDNANYNISEGENVVRKDNLSLGNAKDEMLNSHTNVDNDNSNPLTQSKQERDKYIKDLEAKQEADKKYQELSIKTNQDSSNETINIKSLEEQKQDDLDGKRKKALQDIANLTVQLAEQTMQAINTIRNNGFAKESMQLDILAQKQKIQNDQKVAAINASTNFQIAKDNQLAIQAAQNQAKQNEITQQQNQLAIKKAKADKTAAEAGIVLNTALALTKVLPLYAEVATIPFAIAETAIITAIGAAQYAAAASAPIPQYWTGGITQAPTFSAGERGFELITPNGGKPYFSTNTASIYSEPIGTKIDSHEDTVKMIQYAVSGILIKQPNEAKQKEKSDITLREVKLAIENSNEELAYAILNSKTNVIVQNKQRSDNLTWRINKNK